MDDQAQEVETEVPATEAAPKVERAKKLATDWAVTYTYMPLKVAEGAEPTEQTKTAKISGLISRAIRRSRKALNAMAASGQAAIAAMDPATSDATATVVKPAGAEAYHLGGKGDPAVPKPEPKPKKVKDEAPAPDGEQTAAAE